MSDVVKSAVPLLIVSCDAYADVWPPFFQLLWRRWPDCPFPIYLGTNYRTFDHPRVTTICTQEDTSWAAGVRRMLDRLQSTHVIVLLEDFFLKSPVNSQDVLRAVEVAVHHNVDCLRLSPAPGTTTSEPSIVRGIDLPIGVLPRQILYRVSCQPAVWRVEALKSYLVPGFTPWEFELLGTQMSEFRDDSIWTSLEPLIVYDHAVEKGRWRPDGLRICQEAGVVVDIKRRPCFTPEEIVAHYESGDPNGTVSGAKNQVIRAFEAGRKAAGLKGVFRLISQRPLWLQLWALAVFGLLGARPLQWLRRQQLRRRITHALSRDLAIANRNVRDYL